MVGRVVKVTEHPDAAALYVEEIDLGEVRMNLLAMD